MLLAHIDADHISVWTSTGVTRYLRGNPTRFLPEGITMRVLYLLEKLKTTDWRVKTVPVKSPENCKQCSIKQWKSKTSSSSQTSTINTAIKITPFSKVASQFLKSAPLIGFHLPQRWERRGDEQMVGWHLCSASWVIIDTAARHVSCVCVRLPLLLCSKAVTLMSDRHLLQCCYYFHIRGNLSPQMRVHAKARSAKTSSVSSLSRALPLLLLCFTALKWSNDDTEHLQPDCWIIFICLCSDEHLFMLVFLILYYVCRKYVENRMIIHNKLSPTFVIYIFKFRYSKNKTTRMRSRISWISPRTP